MGQYTIVLMECEYMYVLKSFRFCQYQLVMKNESGDYIKPIKNDNELVMGTYQICLIVLIFLYKQALGCIYLISKSLDDVSLWDFEGTARLPMAPFFIQTELLLVHDYEISLSVFQLVSEFLSTMQTQFPFMLQLNQCLCQ